MTKTAQVLYPSLIFGEDATPRSQVFEDVYFSRHGGIAETQHVFIQGNELLQRWRDGTAEPRSGGGKEQSDGGGDTPFTKPFTIAELGFGTGLNFLVTWQEFNRSGTGRLDYIAIEKFPLDITQLAQALSLQPELAPWATQLIAQYPARLPGWHRLMFGNVSLTLGFGDVAALLPDINTTVDAWYLDGFAPARNEAMWAPGVLEMIGQKSAPDASFATFTAAAAVRRGLEASGFAVRKVPGFGKKREMLVGSFMFEGGLAPPTPFGLTPAASGSPLAPVDSSNATILVIGGGIAGCSAARALAERGLKVQLLTKSVADGASGNAVGVLFPQLSKQWLTSTHWFFAGADFTRRRAQQWGEGLTETPGMLRLPRHADEEAALRQIHARLGLDVSIVEWVDAAEASRLAGLTLTTGAAWLKQGSWVAPVALCHALLHHPNITLRDGIEVQQLSRRESGWQVTLADGEMLRARQVILANAAHANMLLPHALPMGITSGQVSVFAAQDIAAMPNIILCHKGYVVPRGDQVLIGATYDREDLSGMVTAENHTKNKTEIEHFIPGFVQGEAIAGRTSFRATTPDRMPYVGQVEPGLWVSLGHGSRGFCSAPLAGEIIASELCGNMLPVDPALRRAVDVQRIRK